MNKKHKLLIIIFISIIFSLFYIKDTYATTISGHAYEEDEEENLIPISDIKVTLENENGIVYTNEIGEHLETYTNESGEYIFEDLNLESDKSYQIRFTWGEVPEDLLNSDEIIDIEKIKNIIKYNGRDYEVSNSDEVSEDVEIRKSIDNNFKYAPESDEREKYFDAINWNIDEIMNQLENFKSCASVLSRYVSMSGTSEITIEEGEDNYEVNLKLRKRPKKTFSRKLTVTGMKVTSSDGGIIAKKRAKKIGTDLPLMITKDPSTLYGAILELEYSLKVENKFETGEGIDEIHILAYVPSGFLFYVDNISSNRGEAHGIQVTTQEEVKDIVQKDKFLRENVDLCQEIREAIKENENVILITIKFLGDEERFKENDKFIVKFNVNKLLRGEDNETYQENATIYGYSSDSGEEPSNYKATFTNLAIIIPPTGGDKRKIGIFIIVVILVIIQIIIINIFKKKKK